jgi:hypothetical protein
LRQRWWGASGRKVPEIAVEGDDAIPLEEARVLAADDDAELRRAHEEGVPVVVRADSAEAVKRALARPEVSAVLVPREHDELLELDLTRMTYE